MIINDKCKTLNIYDKLQQMNIKKVVKTNTQGTHIIN